MNNIIRNFFQKTEPQSYGYDEQTIKSKYLKFRISVFSAATIGYALFYVCRLSINVAKKPLVDAGVFTESQLGMIGSALFFSYAIGKLINGFISDRININRFIGTGLLLTALVNIAMGVYPLFILFLILWGLNGWFQSAGAAPCVVALTRWFNRKERGTYYGIWSASHNIGKALTFSILPFLIGIGGWQWGFWGAGILGLIGSLMVFLFLYDSPQSKGLPPVESPEKELLTEKEDKTEVAATQKQVVRNPYIWILALSSALMYISRYAIESWGIFYAQTDKGYTNAEAAGIIGLTAITGIAGTVVSGFVSDKFFRSSRNWPALIAGILNILSLSFFLFYPDGSMLTDSVAMLVHGFAIGILITFIGGLMAVDIAPNKATGAAMGLIGIASYAGAGIQELLSGWLISSQKTNITGTVHYDFTIARYFWLGAAVLSVFTALLVWNAHKKRPSSN
jgi:OPA family sugar phosphate sensor protein UhpC-like MFS transporter